MTGLGDGVSEPANWVAASGEVVRGGGCAGQHVGPWQELLRTQSVRLIFATDALSYSVDIPREQEGEAITFAETVKRAVKRHKD